MFQDNLKKASRVFQECFNEVLFDKFFVAWISSQLPEQKEGLFLSQPEERQKLFIELQLPKNMEMLTPTQA